MLMIICELSTNHNIGLIAHFVHVDSKAKLFANIIIIIDDVVLAILIVTPKTGHWWNYQEWH